MTPDPTSAPEGNVDPNPDPNPNPGASASGLATLACKYLQLDDRVAPLLARVFEKTPRGTKNADVARDLQQFTLLVDYPRAWRQPAPYQFSVVAADLARDQLRPGVELAGRVEVPGAPTPAFHGVTNAHGWCGVRLEVPPASFTRPAASEDPASFSPPSGGARVVLKAKDPRSGATRVVDWSLVIDAAPRLAPESVHLSLLTDKRLYRPGDPLRYLGVLWGEWAGCFLPLSGQSGKPDEQPRDDEESPPPLETVATVRLRAPDQRVLFQRTVTPTRHGVTWGEFPVVEDLPEGHYALELEYQPTGASTRARFEVRQYQRPEIEVSCVLPDPWICAGPANPVTRLPVHARYYYGDPVAGGVVTLALASIQAAGHEARLPDPLDLGTETLDAGGRATLEVSLEANTLCWHLEHGQPASPLEVDWSALQERVQAGLSVNLEVLSSVDDQHGRVETSSQWVRASVNACDLEDAHVVVENAVPVLVGFLRDRRDNAYAGPLRVHLADEVDLVLPEDSEVTVTGGRVYVPLEPRVPLGPAPVIHLRGTLAYQRETAFYPLEVDVTLDARRPEGGQFRVSFPESVPVGRPFQVVIESDTYRGPLWVTYEKKRPFAQVEGMIRDPAGEFTHELTLPGPIVGPLYCRIAYFEFGASRGLRVEEKTLALPESLHLLGLDRVVPARGDPGGILPVTISRGERSPGTPATPDLDVDSWLLALKVADKALRGLDAMTEMDPSRLYSLPTDRPRGTLVSWKAQQERLVTAINDQTRAALDEHAFEPNLFVEASHLARILVDRDPTSTKTMRPVRRALQAQWNHLQADPARVLAFFRALTPANLQVAAAEFGNYYFPRERLGLETLEAYLALLSPENIPGPAAPAGQSQAGRPSSFEALFLDYLAVVVRGVVTRARVDDSWHDLTRWFGDALVTEALDRLRVVVTQLAEYPPDLYHHVPHANLVKIARVVSTRTFQRTALVQHYEYFSVKGFRRLSRELEGLEALALDADEKVLRALFEIFRAGVKSHPHDVFPDPIVLEADAPAWENFTRARAFFTALDSPALAEDIADLVQYFGSREFYHDFYDNHRFHLLFMDFPKYICQFEQVRARPDPVQRAEYYAVTLEDLRRNLVPPVNRDGLRDLVPDVLYRYAYLRQLVSRVNADSLPPPVTKTYRALQAALDRDAYLAAAFASAVDRVYLADLVEMPLFQFPGWVSANAKKAEAPAGDPTAWGFPEECSGEFPVDPAQVFRELFGDSEPALDHVQALFFVEVARAFTRLLKKGTYFSVSLSLPQLVEYVDQVEDFFTTLQALAREHAWAPVTAELEVIETEGLFKVFYMALLAALKADRVSIPDIYDVPRALTTLDPEGRVAASFPALPARPVPRHLPVAIGQEMLYLLAKLLRFKYRAAIPARPAGTPSWDFQFYRRLHACVASILVHSPVREPEVVETVECEAPTPRVLLTAFWDRYDLPFPLFFTPYRDRCLETLAVGDDNAKAGSTLEASLARALFASFLARLVKLLSDAPLLATLVYPRLAAAAEYKHQADAVLAAFRAHPCATTHAAALDRLAYLLVAAGSRVAAYYEKLARDWRDHAIPLLYFDETFCWFGLDAVDAIPAVVGYPKYTSIMTDVTGDGAPPETTPPAGDQPGGKKTTIRSRFDDVGYWEVVPDWTARAREFALPLPDSITTQEVHVAAFDARGRMDYTVDEVRVTQEIFLAVTVPARLTLGDEIEVALTVTNTTETPLAIRVTRSPADGADGAVGAATGRVTTVTAADGLMVDFLGSQSFDLPPHAIHGLPARLRATTCGRHSLRLVADSAAYRDELVKEVRVVAGFPSQLSHEMVLMDAAGPDTPVAHEFQFHVPDGVTDAAYHLVVHPSVTSHVLDGIEANLRYPYGCTEQILSALTPCLAYHARLVALGRPAKPGSTRTRLADAIVAGYLRLQAGQNSDGGFGWWRHERSSLWVSALALEAYRRLHALGFLAETYTVRQVVSFLFKHLDQDAGTWPVPDPDTERVIAKFSAVTLSALIVRAIDALRADLELNAEQAFLHARAVDALRRVAVPAINDCYTLYLLFEVLRAHAPARLPEVTARIFQLQVTDHWIGGSALGGDVETTACIAKALSDSGNLTRDQQGAILAWLYRQKHPRGGWGTTAGTRAVVDFLVTLAGQPCDVRVSARLDGRALLDGYHVTSENLSQAFYELSHVPLAVDPGRPAELHSLVVTLEGSARPLVSLVRETWDETATTPPPGLAISRAPARLRLGLQEDTRVTLALEIPPAMDAMAVVEEPKIPGARVLPASLDALVRAGDLVGFREMGDHVAFFLPPGHAHRELVYSVRAVRPFRGTQRPPRVYPMYAPAQVAHGLPTECEFTRREDRAGGAR